MTPEQIARLAEIRAEHAEDMASVPDQFVWSEIYQHRAFLLALVDEQEKRIEELLDRIDDIHREPKP